MKVLELALQEVEKIKEKEQKDKEIREKEIKYRDERKLYLEKKVKDILSQFNDINGIKWDGNYRLVKTNKLGEGKIICQMEVAWKVLESEECYPRIEDYFVEYWIYSDRYNEHRRGQNIDGEFIETFAKAMATHLI